MSIPENPYIVYGMVTQAGVPQSSVTVTVTNLTLGGSDTCMTDINGNYIYDDLAQLPNKYYPNNIIQISSPGKCSKFTVASLPEEKQIDLSISLIPITVHHYKQPRRSI